MIKINGNYIDSCTEKNGLKVSKVEDNSNNQIKDITIQMKEFVDHLAMEKMTVPPKEIWKQTRAHFYKDELNPVRGLLHNQVINRVNNIRHERCVGKDSKRIVEEPDISLIKSKFILSKKTQTLTL